MNINIEKSFAELYKEGVVEINQVDDYVEFWHDSKDDLGELHEFLGLTWEQYGDFIEDESSLEKLRRC